MVSYKCKKISHLKKDYRSPISSNEQRNNEDLNEKLRNQMNRTWKKKEGSTSEASAFAVTQFDGSGDQTYSN